jgi:hypothetical protein
VSAGHHLADALAAESRAYRLMLAGEPAGDDLRTARDAYLASHAETGPKSWGRLIGALKMAILAGDGVEPIARQALNETETATGPAAAYARALAAVALGDLPDVQPLLDVGNAFARTGVALDALARGDIKGYRSALETIVRDFEGREQHLSGVPIADTALVLEQLAAARSLAARPASPLVPIY